MSRFESWEEQAQKARAAKGVNPDTDLEPAP